VLKLKRLPKVILIASLVFLSLGNYYLDNLSGGLDETVVPELYLLILFINGTFALLFLGVTCFIIYKLWEVVPDDDDRITPLKAAGFFIIPLFNNYWGFIAFTRWAANFNRYIYEKGVNTPIINREFSYSPAILNLVLGISFYLAVFDFGINLGWVSSEYFFIVVIIVFFYKAIDGANAIIDYKQKNKK